MALRVDLDTRRIEVDRKGHGGAPAVFVDPDQVGLVFANLFRNAYEAGRQAYNETTAAGAEPGKNL